jgi:signal transduction histidine kinase
MAFYRIAQEAIANAVHHARAAQATLHLDFRERQLVMAVSDDGMGFMAPEDPSAFARQGHYGLLGMRERADLIEAIFELKSAPGEGASIQITWPS